MDDTFNFTIHGHLGIPGPLRVPPPFGAPIEVIRAIEARWAAAWREELSEAFAASIAPAPFDWRPRLTVVAVGVLCTVAAALLGWSTGQRRQPLLQAERAPTPVVVQSVQTPPESTGLLAASHAGSETPSAVQDTVAPLPVEPATTTIAPSSEVAPAAIQTAPQKARPPASKPRRPVKTTARALSPVPVHTAPDRDEDEPVQWIEDAPVAAYVAPGTSVRMELQRHTRLTD